MRSGQDTQLNETLTIVLDRASGAPATFDNDQLRDLLFNGLKRVNQDFREVSRMFTANKIIVEQCEYSSGPFAGRDIRLKNPYVATA